MKRRHVTGFTLLFLLLIPMWMLVVRHWMPDNADTVADQVGLQADGKACSVEIEDVTPEADRRLDSPAHPLNVPPESSSSPEIILLDGQRPAVGVEVSLSYLDEESDLKSVIQLSSSTGEIHLPADFVSSGVLRIVDHNWRLLPAASWTEQDEERIQTKPSRTKFVLVERVLACSLSFQYSDGIPYSGGILFLAKDRLPLPREVVEPSNQLFKLPSGFVWSVSVPSRRPGFSATGRRLTDELGTKDEPIQIILEAADAQTGVIEVDLSSFPATSFAEIFIRSREKSTLRDRTIQRDRIIRGEGSIPWGDTVSRWPVDKIYVSQILEPGAYVITVNERLSPSTPRRTTQSARIDVMLEAGDTLRVRPLATAPGTIKAQVVDEYGSPLPRARIAMARAGYVNWERLRNRPAAYSENGFDGFALADEFGVASWSGLPGGSYEVICGAEGYEPRLLQAEVTGGLTSDLGIVSLTPATGRIIIEIEHPDPDAENSYKVRLLRPRSSTVGPVREFKGQRIELDGLVFRHYTVSIEYVPGGYAAWAQNVELTAADPEARVRFVMRKWPFKED
jgi:hypothetical protein